MNEMVLFKEDFGSEPTEYDFDRFVSEMREVHQIKRIIDSRVAVYCGVRLLAIKDRASHGKLLEAYEQIGIEPRTAQNYMLIAQAFRDNPGCLEGIGIKKAIAIACQDEGDIVRFKDDGIWVAPGGGIYTHAQVVEMTLKDFEARNHRELVQKSAEVRDLRNKHNELLREKAAMEKDYETQLAINEKLREDSNKAMAEEIRKLNELKQKLHDEIDRLRMEMEEKNEERVEGEEAIRALVDAGGGLAHMMSCLNKVKVRKGYDPELRAQYYGFIRKARELLKMAEERVSAYFGPLIDIDPRDIAHEE